MMQTTSIIRTVFNMKGEIMKVHVLPFDKKIKKMVLEVMKEVRKQEYTPELLVEHQKILEAKYYYWWAMDMQKEEYAVELFTDDFSYYNFGPSDVDAVGQARRSKYVNSFLCTMHMGHQPLIWIKSETEARGIFQYEDHHNYLDDGSQLESWAVYVDDFVKGEDGRWRIKTLRMGYKKMSGAYKATEPPKDWEPDSWDVD